MAQRELSPKIDFVWMTYLCGKANILIARPLHLLLSSELLPFPFWKPQTPIPLPSSEWLMSFNCPTCSSLLLLWDSGTYKIKFLFVLLCFMSIWLLSTLEASPQIFRFPNAYKYVYTTL